MATIKNLQEQIEKSSSLKILEKLKESAKQPELSIPAARIERLPTPKPPQFAINAEQGVASEFHKRIAEMIQAFDASLDDKHEVGLRLVNFGQTVVFHLERMGYYDPFLITFSGTTEEGEPVSLIQHVNQISIMLKKLPRTNPDEPKKPIGFASEHED